MYFPASVTSISIDSPLGTPEQVPSSDTSPELLVIGSLTRKNNNARDSTFVNKVMNSARTWTTLIGLHYEFF